MYVQAYGGSANYFGPYNLKVGCNPLSLVISDSVNANVAIKVGSAITSVFTFTQPTSSLAYCLLLSNVVVNPDVSGTVWTPPAKLSICATQPCNVFDLVDTINPEVITFKIKTTFTNL